MDVSKFFIYTIASLALGYGYFEMCQNNQRADESIKKIYANCSLKEERLKGQIEGLEKGSLKPSVTVNNTNKVQGIGKQD